MVRFHDKNDVSLVNTNTADFTGLAVYMCSVYDDLGDRQVSLFEVEADTSWGVYCFCEDGDAIRL